MLNRITILSAACLMASAGLFVVPSANADDVTVTRTTTVTTPNASGMADVKLPAGITAKNLNDDKSIDKAIKNLTEDALSKTGFDNFVGKLVDQDRDRMKTALGNGR